MNVLSAVLALSSILLSAYSVAAFTVDGSKSLTRINSSIPHNRGVFAASDDVFGWATGSRHVIGPEKRNSSNEREVFLEKQLARLSETEKLMKERLASLDRFSGDHANKALAKDEPTDDAILDREEHVRLFEAQKEQLDVVGAFDEHLSSLFETEKALKNRLVRLVNISKEMEELELVLKERYDKLDHSQAELDERLKCLAKSQAEQGAIEKLNQQQLERLTEVESTLERCVANLIRVETEIEEKDIDKAIDERFGSLSKMEQAFALRLETLAKENAKQKHITKVLEQRLVSISQAEQEAAQILATLKTTAFPQEQDNET